MKFIEPLSSLFTNSKRIILDFKLIPPNTPSEENIMLYFEEMEARGLDPSTAQNRQKFNDAMIARTDIRYLVGDYGEDRSSMLRGSEILAQGRTLHLGIDIFATNLESVYSPCDGEIIRSGYEKQASGYGYYLIIKPANTDNLYVFLGHLGKYMAKLGKIKAGDKIAQLGDYKNNENGGWSRHLHLQMLTSLPPDGETQIGYSSLNDFEANSQKYPDPKDYFNWHF